MKKIFSVLLAFILMFSVSACGKKQDDETATESTQESSQTNALTEEETAENETEQTETVTQAAAQNTSDPKGITSADISTVINGVDITQGKKIKLGTRLLSDAPPGVLANYENELTAVYKGQKPSFTFLICEANRTQAVTAYLESKFRSGYVKYDLTARDSQSNELPPTSTAADGTPVYDYSPEKVYVFVTVTYNEYAWRWSSTVADIANSILNENMTQKQAVAVINKYICDNYSFGECKDVDCDYLSCYRNTSFLKTKVGKCRHYAALFYDLCRYAGITSGLVDGFASRNGKENAHRWNRAYIDGTVYYFDPTWNDYYGDTTKYMFLTAEQISKDHREASLSKVPD